MGDTPTTVTAGNDRRCEGCGGAIPDRMARQRNHNGQLVCGGCMTINSPAWTGVSYSALNVLQQAEMRRREAQALSSVLRVARTARTAAAPNCEFKHKTAVPATHRVYGPLDTDEMYAVCDDHLAGAKGVFSGRPPKVEKISFRRHAHDSGDNAIINHCPFCGSGAVTAGSDGSVECDFCHSFFTVQVQPAHPNMPQTVDGQPLTPPGMPGGQETDLSAPTDPAVEETDDDVATDPLGDADAQAVPGADANENPFGKAKPKPDEEKKKDSGGGKPPWLKGSAVDVTAQRFFTADGDVLGGDRYLRHLAIVHADDPDQVLAKVREENTRG